MKFSAKQLGASFAKLIHEASDKHKDELIKSVAEILVEEGKLSKLQLFKQSFVKTWKEISHELDVTIETPDGKEPNFPKEILGKKTVIKTKSNEALLGGNIIQIDDIYIDNSLRTKIRKIANIGNL